MLRPTSCLLPSTVTTRTSKIHHNNLYADALLSINKSFFDDKFSLSFSKVRAFLDDKNDGEGFEGHLATIANKFSVYNVDEPLRRPNPTPPTARPDAGHLRHRPAGYNGMVYLDVTARSEWASQLAFTPHMNIFYPSVGPFRENHLVDGDLSKTGISFLRCVPLCRGG